MKKIFLTRTLSLCLLTFSTAGAGAQDAPAAAPPARPVIKRAEKISGEAPKAVFDDTGKPIAGEALFIVHTTVEGGVDNLLHILSTSPECEEAAGTAISAWKYSPATKDGAPVARWKTEVVRFAAEGEKAARISEREMTAALFLAELIIRDAESSWDRLDAAMRKKMDSETLVKTWKVMTAGKGAFESMKAVPAPKGAEKQDVQTMRCKFAGGSMDFYVFFGTDGKVTNFSYDEVKEAPVTDAPQTPNPGKS